ncbi:MAG: glycosyltransferase family 87 protein [Candidatus Saccharimonadales bacterium]
MPRKSHFSSPRTILLSILTLFLLYFSYYLLASFINEFFLSAGYFKGTHNDFLAFYSTGQLTAYGDIASVYNEQALTAIQRGIVPHPVSALGYMPFLNPPFVALLLAPLGLLAVNDARLVWMIVNAALMIGIAWYFTLGIASKWQRGIIIGLIATTYPVFQNLIQGQLSIIITGLVIAAMYCAEKGKLFTAGLFLTCLTIKPQLAVFVGLGLLLFRQWRVIKGMVVGTAALLLVTLPFTGVSLYTEYIHFSSGVAAGHVSGAGTVGETTWEGNMKYMYSLPGLAVSLFGQRNVASTNAFYFGIGALLIMAYLWVARRTSPSFRSNQGRIMLATGLAIILLINPHAYSQDAILLLAIPAVILPIWRDQRQTIIVFLAAMTLQYVDQMTGLHLTTLALLGFVCGGLFVVRSGKYIATTQDKVPYESRNQGTKKGSSPHLAHSRRRQNNNSRSI